MGLKPSKRTYRVQGHTLATISPHRKIDSTLTYYLHTTLSITQMDLNNNTVFKIARAIHDAFDKEDHDLADDMANQIGLLSNKEDFTVHVTNVFNNYGLTNDDPNVSQLIQVIVDIANQPVKVEPLFHNIQVLKFKIAYAILNNAVDMDSDDDADLKQAQLLANKMVQYAIKNNSRQQLSFKAIVDKISNNHDVGASDLLIDHIVQLMMCHRN